MATTAPTITRFPAPIDHVYILCDPLKEPDRAKYLTTWLATHNVDPTQYTLGCDCYGTDAFFQSRDVWRLYNPWSTLHGRRPLNFNSRNLKPAELSLVLNFAGAAYKAVAARHKVVMILESDILFADDFFPRLESALAALTTTTTTTPWDFLSLSASAEIYPDAAKHAPGRLWYPPNHPLLHTRCTDSMIFRVPMLAKILGTLFPFGEALDWELNFQLSLHKAATLWLHPPVTSQGSGVVGSGRRYLTTI